MSVLRASLASGAPGGSAQVRELTAQNTELRLAVERTEQEREFYFEKLQDIEFLCQRPEFANQTLTKVVERILYFTEGKPDIEAIIAECSAAEPEPEAVEQVTEQQQEAPPAVVVEEEEAAPVEVEEEKEEEAAPAEPEPVKEEEPSAVAEEEEEEVFADAETGNLVVDDLDTTIEADVGNGDITMLAASPPSPAAKSPAGVPRSPLASQPVNV